MIPVYTPTCSVILFKLISRTDGVAARYAGARQDMDLTPYLGDAGSWRTAKGIGDAVGGFSVSFADHVDPVLGDTAYAAIEPMDMIEIRASRTPWLFAGGKLPLIMRGFVSSVSRSESIDGAGQPMRSVVVQGQDFGKLWQIQQVLFEVGYQTENFYMEKFQLQAATGISASILPVATYMQELTDALNKKVAALSVFANKQVPQFICEATVTDGAVSANTVANYTGPYWGLAVMFADRPWNEIFIEDQEDGPHLIHRPTPYKDINGALLNGAADPGTIGMDQSDIVSLNVVRSDANVANFFKVDPGYSSLDTMASLNVVSIQDGLASDFSYGNNRPELFGVKKLEVATHLLDTDLAILPNMAPAGPQRAQAQSTYPSWWKNRLDGIVKMNRDNGVFESGDMQVKGGEDLRAGRYLQVTRGSMISEVYITRVDHSYAPLNTWTSAVSFERGTGFLVRNKTSGAPMWLEGRPGPYSP